MINFVGSFAMVESSYMGVTDYISDNEQVKAS
ncbi:hypothetical protein AHMF7616_05277 [Adhaeribacter pallidiroseus]|uniref:Uncharacterized protein n=1 Tax=Adhaeribacter pallidiroseus TaxID=2072847 RepID=A0A369Q641_9BACT|nr:hypothetical protein AHMF7616_05201 [Adhaeribacter pallidiroseus]RDC58843.1 hypothetical protein AHMF7616_05277 [Adhaeribacter pallidiroseus]